LEWFLHLLLELGNVFIYQPGDQQIIHINSNNQRPARGASSVDHVLMVAVHKHEGMQRHVELGIPSSWCLSKPIHHLLELQHLMIFSNNKAQWLPSIHVLLQLSVEKGEIHVHMVDTPPFVCCHCKDQSNRFHAGNRHENLFEVDSLPLHIAFHDEPGWRLDDAPVLIPLCFVNPFEANRSLIA
jgi:hypothetical protein